MKVKHVLFLAVALVGLLYIAHMLYSHQGQQILPGLGVNVNS